MGGRPGVPDEDEVIAPPAPEPEDEEYVEENGDDGDDEELVPPEPEPKPNQPAA